MTPRPSILPFPTISFLDRNAATIDVGATLQIGKVSLRASYSGEFGNRTTVQSVNGKISLAF